MIRVRDLAFHYRRGDFHLVLPSLDVPAGETVAVVGPSGSGKTTLLHLIGGILTPDAGSIAVDDVEVTDLGDGDRRAFRIARVGMVFQEFELLEYLGVLDNVLLPYRITSALRLDAAVRARAAALVEQVGLGDKTRRPVRQLSQGERQRVGVCRALLPDPPLLFADEPTGNLDPRNAGRVLDILFEFAKARGSTLVTVTHDHTLLDRFDRVLDAAAWTRS